MTEFNLWKTHKLITKTAAQAKKKILRMLFSPKSTQKDGTIKEKSTIAYISQLSKHGFPSFFTQIQYLNLSVVRYSIRILSEITKEYISLVFIS